MDVTSKHAHHFGAMTAFAHALVGVGFGGTSGGPNGFTVHLYDPSKVAVARALLDNSGVLSLSGQQVLTTAETLIVSLGGVDVSADNEVLYVVLKGGEVYDSGTLSVSAGMVEGVQFPVAGTYTLLLARSTGAYESGSLVVTVNEV